MKIMKSTRPEACGQWKLDDRFNRLERSWRILPAAGMALLLCVGTMQPAIGNARHAAPLPRLMNKLKRESKPALSKPAQIGALIDRARSAHDAPHELAKRLSDRGTGALPLLLDTLASRRYVVKIRDDVHSVHPLQGPPLAVVQAAVAMYPWPVVKDQIEARIGSSPTLPERKRALALMGAALPGAELGLLQSALVHLDRRAARSLRQPFFDALSAILLRDPATDEQLPEFYTALDPGLLSPLLKALQGLGGVRGATALSGLLGLEPEADPLLLVELANLARTTKAPMTGPTLERIRRFLPQLSDASKVEAAKALGRFDDVKAIPQLIALLDAKHQPLAETARRSLELLSRERYGSDAQAWSRWYEAANEWLSAEAPGLLAEVRGSDPTRARRALLSLARYRVFRHSLAEGVASALASPNEDVVEMGCTVLGHFATLESIPYLVRVLGEHRPESTRKAAFDALVRATGENHGEKADDWIAAGWKADVN